MDEWSYHHHFQTVPRVTGEDWKEEVGEAWYSFLKASKDLQIKKQKNKTVSSSNLLTVFMHCRLIFLFLCLIILQVDKRIKLDYLTYLLNYILRILLLLLLLLLQAPTYDEEFNA